ALKQDAAGDGTGLDMEVGTLLGGLQVGARGAVAATVANVAVEGSKAFLAVAVDVVSERVACLLHSLEEGLEERIGARARFEMEWTCVAVVVAGARGAALGAFEVGEHVGIIPILHALVARPFFVIHGVAADVDHAIDAAGAAKQLAASVVD